MASILQNVNIYWSDDFDNVLTHAESPQPLLNQFFTVTDWDFIREIHTPLMARKAF